MRTPESVCPLLITSSKLHSRSAPFDKAVVLETSAFLLPADCFSVFTKDISTCTGSQIFDVTLFPDSVSS